MPAEFISYEQLLAELERRLRSLQADVYDSSQLELMQQGIIGFFYQLVKGNPEAVRDVDGLMNRLGLSSAEDNH